MNQSAMYEPNNCKVSGASEQRRLDALEDRLLKLGALMTGALDNVSSNADRIMGFTPTVPGNGPMLRGGGAEPTPDSSFGRLTARVDSLFSLAEALNSQAHRFDAL